jgi:hypothetical protein
MLVISANATENDFFNTIGKADVAQKNRRLPLADGRDQLDYSSFAQPTLSQISKRERVTTDIPVETTIADDTVSTCTLYC